MLIKKHTRTNPEPSLKTLKLYPSSGSRDLDVVKCIVDGSILDKKSKKAGFMVSWNKFVVSVGEGNVEENAVTLRIPPGTGNVDVFVLHNGKQISEVAKYTYLPDKPPISIKDEEMINERSVLFVVPTKFGTSRIGKLILEKTEDAKRILPVSEVICPANDEKLLR